jgi:hypothetical protein
MAAHTDPGRRAMSDAVTLNAFAYLRNGTRALRLMFDIEVKSGTALDHRTACVSQPGSGGVLRIAADSGPHDHKKDRDRATQPFAETETV